MIEAIRYSYDFVDAAAEFAYAIVSEGPGGDSRTDNWLRRYADRQWPELSLSDELGILAFCRHGVGFWQNENQRQLFDDLRIVRNALTHPGIFSVLCAEGFADYSGPALDSHETIEGKMCARKQSVAMFAQHPSELCGEDARKAVEIALRHAKRFEELFGRAGACLFGVIDSRSGESQNPQAVLTGMQRRYFDESWMNAS